MGDEMPIYEYHCEKCDNVFEILQKVDDPLPECPSCGKKKVKKLINAPALRFVGPGWTPKYFGEDKGN
jgi:putative FmdB family regulatory protein